MITKITDWIKANFIIAIIVGLALIYFLFWKQIKRLISPVRRVHHRRHIKALPAKRRRLVRVNRKPLPRSVGLHKASGRGYPKAGGGFISFKRNKNGTIKNAKFVAGTVAAKNYMAKLRRAR